MVANERIEQANLLEIAVVDGRIADQAQVLLRANGIAELIRDVVIDIGEVGYHGADLIEPAFDSTVDRGA